MKFTAAVILAASALTSAQLTSNPDGTFTCAIADAAYCATTSLGSPIIVRCTGTVGHPGNCDDNLDGVFPQGLSYAPCWQSSATAGDAACSKNCIVYEGSGSGKQSGTFSLPSCSPTATASSTSTPASSVTFYPMNSTSTVFMQSSSLVTVTSTDITTTPTVGPIATGTGSAGTGAPGGSGNATSTFGTGSATATPKSPTTTAAATFAGAATANHAGLVLASVGLLVAYFL